MPPQVPIVLGTQAFYKHFYIGYLNNKQQLHFVKIKNKWIFFLNYIFFLNSGRARVNRAGRCIKRAGRKPVREGRSALGNRPSWNTDLQRSFCHSSWAILWNYHFVVIGCGDSGRRTSFCTFSKNRDWCTIFQPVWPVLMPGIFHLCVSLWLKGAVTVTSQCATSRWTAIVGHNG